MNAISWSVLEKEGKRILHGRNGKECQLPVLSDIRVDGICEETRTMVVIDMVLRACRVETLPPHARATP
jgi:hypothetical protein